VRNLIAYVESLSDEAIEKSQGDTKAELQEEKRLQREEREDPMEPGLKEHIASSPHAKTHKLVNYYYAAHDDVNDTHEDRHETVKEAVGFAHRAGLKGHKIHISMVDLDPNEEQSLHVMSAWKPKK